MVLWAEHLELICILAGPSVFLLTPFLIVFLVLRIRWALVHSIILHSICLFLEFIWFTAAVGGCTAECMIGMVMFLMPNIFVILTVIVYAEIIKVRAPIKTSSILSSFCGFFHVFGMWLYVGGFSSRIGGAGGVIILIFASSVVGIVGAVAYPIVNIIFHGGYRLIKKYARLKTKVMSQKVKSGG